MEYRLRINGRAVTVTVTKAEGDRITAAWDGREFTARWRRITDSHFSVTLDGTAHAVFLESGGGGRTVLAGGVPYVIEETAGGTERNGSRGREPVDGKVTSPMPSQVVRVMARPGMSVAKGEGLLVVSAMKLETTLSAPFSGTVVSVSVKEGDRVMPGQELARVGKEQVAEG